jgi:AraC-like DNA-binding protein
VRALIIPKNGSPFNAQTGISSEENGAMAERRGHSILASIFPPAHSAVKSMDKKAEAAPAAHYLPKIKPVVPGGLKGLFWCFPASVRDKEWGIYVTTIGLTHVAPHQSYPPTGHPKPYDYQWEEGRRLPFYAVVYISRGRGWLDLERMERRPVQAGNVILLFPGVWHRYGPDREVGWDEHWVAFSGTVAKRWMKQCSFSPDQPVLKARNEEVLMGMFARLIETAQQNPAALQQLMAAQTHVFLATLYSEQQTVLGGGDVANSAIQAAQARMQAEFASDLNVQQLARELNVGYRWFRHAFVQQTGFSPHQYIVELRLARARALLAQSPLKIKEIAGLSGFANEHYFSRIFKTRVGLSPQEWQAQARSES